MEMFYSAAGRCDRPRFLAWKEIDMINGKEFNLAIGAAIAHLRKRRNLKAGVLAKAAHITGSKLSRIECGKSPVELADFLQIADALNAKIEDIIELARVFQRESSRPLDNVSMKTILELRKHLVGAAIDMRSANQ
jgi:transcriptional regulator with XRE-family HTH domain